MATNQQPARKPVTFVLDIPATNLPTPDAANWFHFTRTNLEVQMLVGYVDLYQAHQSAEKNRNGKGVAHLAPVVTHRTMLSITGFLQLRAQVDDLFNKMVATGVLSPEAEVLPSSSQG